MVLLLSFLKSTQNLLVPSFLTITTLKNYGLWLGLIAPASSISARCTRTFWNNAGGMRRCGCLNGSLSWRLILCFTKSQLPKSVMPFENIPFHFGGKISCGPSVPRLRQSQYLHLHLQSTPSGKCRYAGAVSSNLCWQLSTFSPFTVPTSRYLSTLISCNFLSSLLIHYISWLALFDSFPPIRFWRPGDKRLFCWMLLEWFP